MLRRLVLAGFAVAAIAPPAAADGPPPSVLDGGDGVLAASGAVRYVTIGTGKATVLQAVRTSDGRVLRWRLLPGRFGVPLVAFDGTAGGLARGGSLLVLAEPSLQYPLRSRSRFLLLNPKRLYARYETIALEGDFSFDALSPNRRTLYLIQHVSASDINRYVVRAYDLARGRLLPGVIADRTQRG